MLKKENYREGLIEVKIVINSKAISAILDSASKNNYISASVANKLSLPFASCYPFALKCANDAKVEVKQRIKTQNCLEDRKSILEEEFYILPANNDIILGNSFAYRYGCIYDYNSKTLIINNEIFPMKFTSSITINKTPKMKSSIAIAIQ